MHLALLTQPFPGPLLHCDPKSAQVDHLDGPDVVELHSPEQHLLLFVEQDQLVSADGQAVLVLQLVVKQQYLC